MSKVLVVFLCCLTFVSIVYYLVGIEYDVRYARYLLLHGIDIESRSHILGGHYSLLHACFGYAFMHDVLPVFAQSLLVPYLGGVPDSSCLSATMAGGERFVQLSLTEQELSAKIASQEALEEGYCATLAYLSAQTASYEAKLVEVRGALSALRQARHASPYSLLPTLR